MFDRVPGGVHWENRRFRISASAASLRDLCISVRFRDRGSHALQDLSAQPDQPDTHLPPFARRDSSSTSLRELWAVLARRRRVFLSIECGLLLLCLLYCLIAPNQYEASAKVALRTAPASALSLDAAGGALAAASILSAPLQQETLANYLRSDQLAWKVITDLKLYRAAAFNGRFEHLFPGFRIDAPAPDAQAYLLERFHKRLQVDVLPRSLVLEIRFRTRDAALSADVVNDLIRVYGEQDSEARVQATVQQSDWLRGQLKDLKTRVDGDQQRLTEFQSKHQLLSTPQMMANGQPSEEQHNSTLLEIDELGKQLVAATTDRILREAEYRSASEGNPEVVFAADPQLQAQYGSFATAQLEQINTHHGELEQELAQLSLEHGPNFPRVVEIRKQLEDLNAQKKVEDAKLVDRFLSAWQTAANREQMVKSSLDERTVAGMKLNEAATEYAVMRQEANSSLDLYMRVQGKLEEAGLAAGVASSNISVVDLARQPVKPVAPDLPLYLAITFFAGLWLAVGGALLMESLNSSINSSRNSSRGRSVGALLAVVFVAGLAHAQAPTPSLDGLPIGVARIPFTPDAKTAPNPKDSPAVWNGLAGAGQAGLPQQPGVQLASPMPAPIGPGDFLDVSEFHTPEFHSLVRVSPAGTVTLPMVNEVEVGGMDELTAAHAIEAALLAKGMLLHPRVSVLVTVYAGQDVSVLGEVARPGVYPYTLHHRLLDLISAASGLSADAGRLVNVFHRSDPNTPHPVVLDPGGTDTAADHNPELSPGDTVQVSRAGLVFVIGDVMRPGGFPVDPAQGLTVVQALSLAWGPSQNAAVGKALLIREQKGGRTLTTLNLRRMIHGQDPDQPIHDRDILFVPDSMAKNMLNRTLEAAIQSAVGVTLYAGLVYSQRF
ncbi:MAG TPA: polysaccharide biosynthesis/export family protein [Acidobacteriaceae bacterium]|nr:polysaccharide biosynthesis/export family protein [Acidobacteriaceae bacterium]